MLYETSQPSSRGGEEQWQGHTVLEHRRAVQLEAGGLGVLILLCVAHLAWTGSDCCSSCSQGDAPQGVLSRG